MNDPAAALQAVVVGVVIVGVIGALWSAIGFGELYERIGMQLFLPRRTAAGRPRHESRSRPSKQLQAIDAALAGANAARRRHARRRADCVR